MEPVYKQEVCIARFQLKSDHTKKIVVKVYYQLGGMSYLSGEVRKRGYCLTALPQEMNETITDDGHVCHWVKTSAFTGTWKMLQEATRYSEKTLVEVARYAEAKQQYLDLLNWVLEKNNLILADYEKEI